MEDRKELLVIGVAMIFFLVICVTAVTLFFRQWRRERGKGAQAKPPDQKRQP
jgi:predicted RND superfamily exporter protein